MRRFLELVTADEAAAHLAAFTASRTETIDARRALGRVAAGDVHAREDIPHFFRSNMDGYAVRSEDTGAASPSSAVALEIVGTVAMGEIPRFRIEPGTAARISTGGMMPEGADAVVLVERTEELPRERVAIRESVAPRDSTIAIGEDLRAGDRVFLRGHRFRAADVGVLTGIGHGRVEVFAVPRAGVIATGDEIVEPEDPLPPGRVRNVNEYLLAALASRSGAIVEDYGVIGDDLDLLRRTIEKALVGCDAVFISGGSSKGAKDSTRGAIEAIGGAEILFHGVSIAPGKPTLLAKRGDKAIMGVPGNPAAVAVSFTLFGGPLLRVLGGERLDSVLLRRPRLRARVAVDLAAPDGRDDYIRVRLESAGADLPIAHPQRGKSVALSTIARADGLVRVVAAGKGFHAGDEVEVLLLD